MSEREMGGSVVAGGVRRRNDFARVLAGAGVLVLLYQLSRSNYLLFRSIVESLDRGCRWVHRAAVAGSLDYGGSQGTRIRFIVEGSSLRPAHHELCRNRRGEGLLDALDAIPAGQT